MPARSMTRAVLTCLAVVLSAGMALPQSDGPVGAAPESGGPVVNTAVPFTPGALEILQDSPNVFSRPAFRWAAWDRGAIGCFPMARRW